MPYPPNNNIEFAGAKFDHNQGHINIGHNYYQSNDDCFEAIDIASSLPSGYIPPAFSDNLQNTWAEVRLLFLQGGHYLNKNDLMKHVANQTKIEKGLTQVKENKTSPSVRDLLNDMRKEDGPSAFLIHRATPGNIEYSFEDIKKAATAGQHYVLISTDASKEEWHFPEGTTDIWYEIPIKDAYSVIQLEQYFKSSLQLKELLLPKYVDESQIVEALNTPENIDLFLDRLFSFKGEITEKTIEVCLQYALNDKVGIVKWFQNLENDHKLLALGLAFCHNLHELQFFEVMDRLILEGWAGRNHHLKPIDYKDIEPLFQYFKIENGYILERYPFQCEGLIKEAWKTHRRFIQLALSVLTKLTAESASSRISNWRLFGASWRINLFREVVVATLTQIGEIDFDSVEMHLLSLSAHESLQVKAVAGGTLADLRPIMGERWYTVIDAWQKNIERQHLVASLLSPKNRLKEDEDGNISLHHIETTITLALGAASQRDKPNQLDRRVLELIKRLARSGNELVSESVKSVVFWVTSRHITQVANDLWDDFLRHPKLVYAVGAGLAECYNNIDAQAARKIIFSWLDRINRNNAQRKKHDIMLHEDRVLCCIIHCFKLLYYDLDSDKGRLEFEEAYAILDDLRRTNHQAIVRYDLFDALVALIVQNPSQRVINYIANLDSEERNMLAERFEEQYLIQRASQTGGEYKFRIRGRKIPIWQNLTERPKTDTEMLMQEWFNFSDRTINQIATIAIKAFTKIEEQGEAALKKYGEEQANLSKIQEELVNDTPDYKAYNEAEDYTKVFIKVATSIVMPEHRGKIENIAPEVLQTTTWSDRQLSEIFSYFDDLRTDKDQRVHRLTYLYHLFMHLELNPTHNPFASSLGSKLLVLIAEFFLNFPDPHHLRGWATILINHREISRQDANIVLSKWGDNGKKIKKYVMVLRILDRNPWIWIILAVMLFLLL